jgi:hypothetical protein
VHHLVDAPALRRAPSGPSRGRCRRRRSASHRRSA